MDKISIAVVYHSICGTTEQLANAITSGVDSIDAISATLFPIRGEDVHHGRFTNHAMLERVTSANAIVFGSPTFMGTVSAQFKAFADATSDIWSVKGWHNKLAAGFTTGTNFSGDQLHTIQYLQVLSAQHGMIWVGVDELGGNPDGLNRLGAQSGLITCTDDDRIVDSDLVTANRYGKRIAQLAQRLC